MPRAVPQTSTIVLEPHQIILRPLVTEKGMHRSTRNNAYAFEVNKLATKDDVRRAVEELFNVKVLRSAHAEPQGQAAPHPVPLADTTGNWKKAIVTLDAEHRIDFF